MAEKKVNLDAELMRHRQNRIRTRPHLPVLISLRGQDSVMWFSEQTKNFRIVKIHKDSHAPKNRRKKGAPQNPFFRKFPARPSGGKRVSSGPARPEALGQQYKVVFRIRGTTVDPHIFIGR